MSSDLGRKVEGRAVESFARSSGRLSILLLCDNDPSHANTLLEHIEAFRRYSAHDVRMFNPRWLRGSRTLALEEFDVVVIHYSLCIIVDQYLAPDFREKLRKYRGLKVQFIQDDYRWVNSILRVMREIGVDVLFTLVPPAEIPRIWTAERLPRVVKISTLAGYVPESLFGLAIRPLDRRPIDIGYRGRELPYWIGRLGQEKVWIAQGVLARAEKYGLRCDIAWTENDRIYGQAWNEFLVSCRTTLGTESGASITDFDGSIEGRVRMYLAENPGADFEEVHRAILWEFEDNVRMNVISPRIFEAIALRTPLVLFPGEYSGVIRPWVHYIPLEKDFSNMDAVVERLRDTRGLVAMSDRAYDDVVRSGRYSLRTFVREFDEVVERYAVPGKVSGKMWYYGALVERRVKKAAAARLAWLRNSAAWHLAWHLMKRSVNVCIALELVLRYRETRVLLFRLLRYRELRRAARPGMLLKDLFRVCILRRLCGGMRESRDGFWVSVRLEATGVEFLSQPATAKECGEGRQVRGSQWAAEIADSAIGGLRRGQFAVVWNHSGLGSSVSYPLTRWKSVSIWMGGQGVYDFPAFRRVAMHSPKQAWATIAALLSDIAPDSRPR